MLHLLHGLIEYRVPNFWNSFFFSTCATDGASFDVGANSRISGKGGVEDAGPGVPTCWIGPYTETNVPAKRVFPRPSAPDIASHILWMPANCR